MLLQQTQKGGVVCGCSSPLCKIGPSLFVSVSVTNNIHSKNSGRSETLNSNAFGTVSGKIRCLGNSHFSYKLFNDFASKYCRAM